eukprot:351963-Chlamydomonas_euryale.AAC.5
MDSEAASNMAWTGAASDWCHELASLPKPAKAARVTLLADPGNGRTPEATSRLPRGPGNEHRCCINMRRRAAQCTAEIQRQAAACWVGPTYGRRSRVGQGYSMLEDIACAARHASHRWKIEPLK